MSAAGASLRNAGDCLSQSGANARNKFAAEMCADECREGAVCLEECSVKFTAFIAEEMEYVPLNLPPSLPKSLARASKNAEMAGRVMFSQGMKGGKGKQDDIDREALGRFLEGVSVNLKVRRVSRGFRCLAHDPNLTLLAIRFAHRFFLRAGGSCGTEDAGSGL